MKKVSYISLIALLIVLMIGFVFLSTPASAVNQNPSTGFRPMVFVHGYTGSAQQFEWQAMRFTSNGYPQKYLNVYEYNSILWRNNPPFQAATLAELDTLIDAIRLETGADKVDLLGHSQGTSVSQAYLNSSPARAMKVAHYVNIDGGAATSLPGGVPTLALWAEFRFVPGSPIPTIVGAENYVIPKSPHNETSTSPVSFGYMYKFFTGHDPESTSVLPEHPGHIRLAGRAVLYPQNIGVDGATLEIYELDSDTGARKHKRPEARYFIDTSGNFGPFNPKAGAYYEFNIARPEGNHHFYLEPRIRSDYFIRLNTSLPGTGLGTLMTRNPDQTNLIITKNREWLGDQSDGFNDILAVNGINIVNAINAVQSHMLVAYFVYDFGSDHITNLTRPLSDFPASLTTAFLSPVDLYLTGATPPNATISIVEIPRGNCGTMHGINVPNWAIINPSGSFFESVSVQLNDYIESRCDEKWDLHGHNHHK